MNAGDLHVLLPWLVLGGALLVLMLTIAFHRSHGVAVLLALAGLLATLVCVVFTPFDGARFVTPLLLVDGYARFFAALFLLGAVVVVVISHRYLHGGPDDPEEYYLLLLAATLGAMTLGAANHFASFFLGLEVLSIALYVLISYPRTGHPPLEAALKYLILSGASSTTLLFGMALVYAATGAMSFPEVAAAARMTDPYFAAGMILVLAGVAFKLSLVPFHMWTPDVYQGAPAPVAAYLATVSKGAVFAVFLRYVLASGALGGALTEALVVLAVASMVVGNLLALQQRRIKRVLAYSAIAHFGYLLIPLIVLGQTDVELAAEATLIYLSAYFVMTLAAFGVVTVCSGRAANGDADDLAAYEGLFWRQPALALTFTVALLSLAGIPLTAGFIAKFYVFAAGVTASAWLLLVALVAGSGIGLYYYLRIIFAMTRTDGTVSDDRVFAASGQWTVGVLGALLVAFGVYPAPIIQAVRHTLQSWGG